MLGCYSQPYSSPHDLLSDYYSRLQLSELHAQLHQRLASAVRQALKKTRARVASFDKQVRPLRSQGAHGARGECGGIGTWGIGGQA